MERTSKVDGAWLWRLPQYKSHRSDKQLSKQDNDLEDWTSDQWGNIGGALLREAKGFDNLMDYI
jgi:hypothetical protein